MNTRITCSNAGSQNSDLHGGKTAVSVRQDCKAVEVREGKCSEIEDHTLWRQTALNDRSFVPRGTRDATEGETTTLMLEGLIPISSRSSCFDFRQKGHVVKENITTGDPAREQSSSKRAGALLVKMRSNFVNHRHSSAM